MKHIDVVAAVITHAGEYLCMQRGFSPYAYVSEKYEFPGGKIEEKESREQALMRELREEMDLEVAVQPDLFLLTVHYVYPDFVLTMHVYRCPVQSRLFSRKEHIAHTWLPLERLAELDWAPADREVVAYLLSHDEGAIPCSQET